MNTTTLTAKKTNKEIKVLAVNTLYEWADKFYAYEKEYFSQFIGVNIFKVDGSIKAKYEHEKMTFKGKLSDGTFVNAHYWFTNTYSFDIKISICVNGGTYDVKPSTAFCEYDEMTLTLFNLHDGKLIETNTDTAHLKERFDIEILKTIANDIEQAKKAYELAENKMPYRFREVFYIGRITNR